MIGSIPDDRRRLLPIDQPIDLAQTAAPVWWARGRWPNVDWRDNSLVWVGWEGGQIVCRVVRQTAPGKLAVAGNGDDSRDGEWAARVLGTENRLPKVVDPVLAKLARQYSGLRQWSAGSLFEGFVSAITGQSISIAAAAVTERRLYERFNPGLGVGDRVFWPPPRPDQLAASSAAIVRESGVTQVRAEALIAAGIMFASGDVADSGATGLGARAEAEKLRGVRGIGPWSVESALLWGIGDPDAHPTGDVALLRATKIHYPNVSTLRDLDRQAEYWRPHRGWAARLLWLDLLGWPETEPEHLES